MAFPIVQSIAVTTDITPPWVVNLPSSNSGNLLVMFLQGQDVGSVTTPTGWTLLGSILEPIASTCKLYIYYKISSGSEGSTVSITASGSWDANAIVYNIINFSGIPYISTGTSGSSSNNPNSDSLTPSGVANDYLWITVCAYYANASISSYPTNYSDNNTSQRDGSVMGIATATRNLNSSSEDPSNFTLSTNAYWVAMTLAVAPVIPPNPRLRPLSQTKFINDANLVSYWKLDGNSNDSKGSNNGTDTDVTYSAGQFDNCGVFNGSTSKITLPNTLPDLTTFTISAWIKTTNHGANQGQIYIQRNSADTATLGFEVKNGKLYSEIWNGSTNKDVTSSASVNDGNWKYVIVTRNGATSKLYINGIQDGITTTSHTITILSEEGRIGSHINAGTNFFNGLIDDIALFSRDLSAGEVAELYQSMTLGEYLPNSSTKLLLHLNGSSADSSGNNNNGTDTAITYSQANGKFGQGVGFNGSSSIISLGTSITIGTGDFTVSAFVYLTSINGSTENMIFSKSNDTGDFPLFQLRVSSTGYLQFFSRINLGGYVTYTITSPSTVSTGQWYLFQFIRIGSSGYLYINGNLVASNTSTFTNASFNQTSYPLTIGAKNSTGTPEQFLNGKIDEVIYETRGWSASEVKKYYTMAKGRFNQ